MFYQVHDLGGHPSDHERIQGSVGTLPYHQRHLTRDSIVMNRDSIVRNRDSIVRNKDSIVRNRANNNLTKKKSVLRRTVSVLAVLDVQKLLKLFA